ncbi:MAG: T9SS type A sorting domain-containing protein, partial [Muribaculaceae bacterium]|nr:T9SS type A sorting domain-containing protein [Muribaculaceae bacterium]
KAYPILGYSLTENFDPDKMGDATRQLLKLYAMHIENVRYDSTVPEKAIAAWQDIPTFIASALKSHYEATDPYLTTDEIMAELAYTAGTYDAPASTSEFYYPDQWESLIDDELALKGTVPLGLISSQGIYPVAVHGRRGDYYRMRLDGPNRQLWRLLPTEILSAGEMAVFGNPPRLTDEEIEDIPFEFYDSFIAATRHEYERDRSAIEESLVVREPAVRWHGLGHYTITLPEQARMVRVYSLDGSQVYGEKFRETNQATFDISSLPTGFYFAVVWGESGKPYGIKLFR